MVTYLSWSQVPHQQPLHVSLKYEFSSLSLNAVYTILTFVEPVAVWLQAFDVDFLKDFFGDCSYGLGPELRIE